MTEPTDDPKHLSPLQREALAWVTKLRSGEATKGDLVSLQSWRDQSAAHEAAFRQAAQLWRDLKQTADAITETRNERQSRLAALRPDQWTPTRRALVGGAIAASAAAYLLYDPPLQLWPSLGELRADYRTGKGEKRDIAVAPDVSVTLSTQTSLTILSSEPQNPRLELVAGEAAVNTRRAPDQPVIIQALGVRVVAARATFNARCIDGQVSITCLDGAVDVEHGRSLVQLHPGQQVTFTANEGLTPPVSVDPEQAAAWRNGLLIVRDQPLSEVVTEVNRHRPGRIVITNADLARRMVTGTFHLDRLDNFPSQVQQLFGASIRALPGGVVLLS